MKVSSKCQRYPKSNASHPFQFISKVLCINSPTQIYSNKMPITQDASASAYQIMSDFLLDNVLAKHTNLIPSNDHIHDI